MQMKVIIGAALAAVLVSTTGCADNDELDEGQSVADDDADHETDGDESEDAAEQDESDDDDAEQSESDDDAEQDESDADDDDSTESDDDDAETDESEVQDDDSVGPQTDEAADDEASDDPEETDVEQQEDDAEDPADEANDPEESTDAELEALEVEAILGVKQYVTTQLQALHDASLALQEAAPEADEDGWNDSDDAEAVEAMREAWRDARVAYESIEGAIAVLFPNYDASTDERYDGFIEEAADENLFDGEGVTGVHAIERILWAEDHPQQVIDFESALPNYLEAAYPQSEEEADDFKNGLAQRLVDDTQAMLEQFEPLALDAPSAFRGVIGSMEEQLEKVALAATGEDESRYAQHTLGDMRANLDGGREIFSAFVPWLEAMPDGEQLASDVLAAFDEVQAYYESLSSDAIPQVPEGWNPDQPAAEDLETDYGQLFGNLTQQADPEAEGSLVSLMLIAADDLGIAQLPE